MKVSTSFSVKNYIGQTTNQQGFNVTNLQYNRLSSASGESETDNKRDSSLEATKNAEGLTGHRRRRCHHRPSAAGDRGQEVDGARCRNELEREATVSLQLTELYGKQKPIKFKKIPRYGVRRGYSFIAAYRTIYGKQEPNKFWKIPKNGVRGAAFFVAAFFSMQYSRGSQA